MSKRTLLLADDSVTIQKVVNLTFADEGIEVITVSDGDAAMEKISQAVPDVILADVHMPGLSGYQICQIVRENPVTKDLPVVLLVGSFEPFDENEAARVGANAYLTKPFQSIRQLVSQVTDLMRPSDNGPELGNGDGEPVAQVVETTDIENLYQQSVGESGAVDTETGTPRYVDAGMDDEMIETDSVNRGETPDTEYAGDVSMSETNHPGSDSSARAEYYGNDSSPEGEYAASDSTMDSAEPIPSDADTGNKSPQGWVTPEAAFPIDGSTETPASDFDQFSRTAQMPVLDQHISSREFVLDDSELLELPPLDNRKAPEPANEPRMVSDSIDKQIDNLSPELMDRIVQRVVEKLAKKE